MTVRIARRRACIPAPPLPPPTPPPPPPPPLAPTTTIPKRRRGERKRGARGLSVCSTIGAGHFSRRVTFTLPWVIHTRASCRYIVRRSEDFLGTSRAFPPRGHVCVCVCMRFFARGERWCSLEALARAGCRASGCFDCILCCVIMAMKNSEKYQICWLTSYEDHNTCRYNCYF